MPISSQDPSVGHDVASILRAVEGVATDLVDMKARIGELEAYAQELQRHAVLLAQQREQLETELAKVQEDCALVFSEVEAASERARRTEAFGDEHAARIPTLEDELRLAHEATTAIAAAVSGAFGG